MDDVESFTERMFPHALTCLSQHCCVNHRAWPVMFAQPMDDAKKCLSSLIVSIEK